MDEADVPEALEEDAETAPASPLELKLTPTRLTLSAKTVIINWRLELRNASETHIVALRIWSDMTSAACAAIHHDEAGKPDMDRAKLHREDFLAPGVHAEYSGEWQMPREEAIPVKQGPVRNFSEPRVLPVARIRLIGAGIEPTFVNFAVGSPGEEEGALPRPLLFDDQMQIFSELAAVQLT
ncbi:hypothetical protein [Aurantiacibacter sp. D1-12]|uniref:hypothetical protein n=1 Tax=Aurantiacibacter sp. D1-12 TaxID=2993658 RepID=UPI00237CE030|nr:hypothetical protein [Aurantiacibacter sp. D1-12]MDE1466923.1 hypothetical protein [Aurantiacibacter sp. D1-12]